MLVITHHAKCTLSTCSYVSILLIYFLSLFHIIYFLVYLCIYLFLVYLFIYLFIFLQTGVRIQSADTKLEDQLPYGLCVWSTGIAPSPFVQTV